MNLRTFHTAMAVFYLWPAWQTCQGQGHHILHELHGSGTDSVRITSFVLATNSTPVEGVFIGVGSAAKPLIIFIPGSEPVPLYCSVGDSTFIPLFPRQLIDPRFNYILLSKPGIPAVCDRKALNDDYYFLDSATGEAPTTYLANNTLGSYREAYANLLDELPIFTKPMSVTLMGHSQGARVAAEFTADQRVDKVVYMSADPLGRIATLYDREYAKFNLRDPGKVRLYEALFDPANTDSVLMRERYSSFTSFSKPSIIGLSQATKPTLVVYGDMDESCPNCYALAHLGTYVPQVDVHAYPGYDHNYFDAQGVNHWGEVVQDVLRWVLGE